MLLREAQRPTIVRLAARMHVRRDGRLLQTVLGYDGQNRIVYATTFAGWGR